MKSRNAWFEFEVSAIFDCLEIGISFFSCCGNITDQNENQISCYLPTKIHAISFINDTAKLGLEASKEVSLMKCLVNVDILMGRG